MPSWNTAKAEALWRKGETASSIYAQVGAPSPSAVIGWMNRRKVGRDGVTAPGEVFWTPERTAEAKRLHDQGIPLVRIAAAMGAPSWQSVQGALNAAGLYMPRDTRPKVRQPGAAPHPKGRPIAPKPPVLAPVLKADAPAPVAEAAEGLKTLWERGPRECCWPVGAPDPARGQLYCAQRVEPGRSYCARHRPTVAGTARPPKGLKETGVIRRRARDDGDDLIDLVELTA